MGKLSNHDLEKILEMILEHYFKKGYSNNVLDGTKNNMFEKKIVTILI